MIKRIITFLLLLIALTALTLLLTLIPEILGAELTSEKGQGFLLVVFGENYAWWLLLILVVAIAVLFFFTPEHIKVLFKREEKPIALTPEETQKNYDTIRQYLRQRYERRKDQKLAGDQLFNLRIKPSTEGTSPEKAETFVTLQGRKTGEEIQQIFEKARRRLLVTGLPGAGKTSLLLNLALELLETAPDHLAVLLNLATWRSDFPSFDDWLREILPAELGVTKRYAADILQAGKLTLLLDGLDEVAEEHRASCLKAIGEYGRLGRDYVISTRKDEYKALEKDAPVWAQIDVLPLTDKQLLAQLDHADRRDFPEAPDLKAALEHDPLLLRVAETPFYLNCLQLLFRGGSTLSELNLYPDEETEGITKIHGYLVKNNLPRPTGVMGLQYGQAANLIEKEIVKRFIEQVLAQPNKHGSPEQVRHWLAFLASRMTQRNKVVFELVDLQYDWWKWSKAVLIFPIIIKETIIFDVLIIFACLLAITMKQYFMLILFLISVWTIAFGSLKKVANPSIETIEKIGFTLQQFLYHYKGNKKWHLIIRVFASGGIFGAAAIYTFGWLLGCFVWIATGLMYVLLISNQEISSSSLQITTPYQRFIASAKALHFSILQHWLLRWQLYRAGVLPLRLVHFLNEMTARHLLETDGATWRFRHRILQEYFAGQWREE